MAKSEMIGVRFEPDEEDALIRAAAEDDRPKSALVRKVFVAWLRANGWLKDDGATQGGAAAFSVDRLMAENAELRKRMEGFEDSVADAVTDDRERMDGVG